MASVKKEPCGNPELGLKLLNFRKKLALSIGQKKITQDEFGEMYGGRSGRVIASYELGDSEAPASLLYLFWQHGNSVDNIFSDGSITDEGKEKARDLYSKAISVILKNLTDAETERIQATLKDKHGQKSQSKVSEKATADNPGSRKASAHQAGDTKKR